MLNKLWANGNCNPQPHAPDYDIWSQLIDNISTLSIIMLLLIIHKWIIKFLFFFLVTTLSSGTLLSVDESDRKLTNEICFFSFLWKYLRRRVFSSAWLSYLIYCSRKSEISEASSNSTSLLHSLCANDLKKIMNLLKPWIK